MAKLKSILIMGTKVSNLTLKLSPSGYGNSHLQVHRSVNPCRVGIINKMADQLWIYDLPQRIAFHN